MSVSNRIYLTFNYPGAVSGSKTLLTGIRGIGDILYISGFYELPDAGGTISFVYKGDITGRTGPCSENSWNTLDYPSNPGHTMKATNLYGPDILSRNNIRVVGNYTTEEAGAQSFGCMYEGSLDGSGKWITLTPTEDTENTIAHSNMGDLVVGNYQTRNQQVQLEGKAFIYDVKTEKYYEIRKLRAKSITAYGIWHNKGSWYTICGGFSDLDPLSGIGAAYLVDWDNKTHRLSNWREYQYKNNDKLSIVTHFDGITADECYGYNLVGDTVVGENNIGFFANINRHRAVWEEILYPGADATSGNSVYKKIVIGVYPSDDNSTINGYLSLVV